MSERRGGWATMREIELKMLEVKADQRGQWKRREGKPFSGEPNARNRKLRRRWKNAR